jgi:hypothetical protein
MKQFVYDTLSSILETYEVEIPQDNTVFPCCVYWLSERPVTSADDKDFGVQYTLNVEAYITPSDDSVVFDDIKNILCDSDEHFIHLIDKSDMLGLEEKMGVSYIFEITKN